MQKFSDYLNKFILATEIKDFMTMENTYQQIKEKFGEFVLEKEKREHFRLRRKLQQDTFFEEIRNNRVEVPKAGIAYLNITKENYTTLHMIDNGCMIISPSAMLSRIYQDGAFDSKVISLDVEENILELEEQNMLKADLHNGDILKIDIENTGIFLRKFALEQLPIYFLDK